MRVKRRIIGLAGAVIMALSGLLLTAAPPASASVTCDYVYCGGSDTLYGGNTLQSGDWLASADKVFTFVMQGDSNLVMYDSTPAPHWASGTSHDPSGAWLAMQTDGNLVIYRAGGTCSCGADAYWSSGTAGHPGAYLKMQTDGNVVIYDSGGHPLWASNTVTYRTTMSATETSYAKPDYGTAVGTRSAGTGVHIWCQANYGADTGHGANVAGNWTWDKTAEGGWVPDWNVNTPTSNSDGFSSGVPRCYNAPATLSTRVSVPTLSINQIQPAAQPAQVFNDGPGYFGSTAVRGLRDGSACQDFVMANTDFWWLWDSWDGYTTLNDVFTWASTSQAHGRFVSSTPAVGDVVVFAGGWHGPFNYDTGHVAMVVKVNDSSSFTIAEYNWNIGGGGPGVMDFRRVSMADFAGSYLQFIR
jgi:hypothetical protein